MVLKGFRLDSEGAGGDVFILDTHFQLYFNCCFLIAFTALCFSLFTLYNVFFPIFLLSASAFVKGNPLVLLSAPVFRLILPPELAKSRHHNPIAPKPPYTATSSPNADSPVCRYCE